MPEAVIVDAARTAVGRRGGALRDVHPVDLGAHVLRGLVERNGLDPALIEDVVFGCVTQVGEQGSNVGRWAALAAGFPETVAGTTVDRACGSSQQALTFAVASVIAGHSDIVIAGGVESMTRVPMGSQRNNGPGKAFGPAVEERYGRDSFSQGEGAEMVAERWNLTRTQLDELALESHARALAATEAGVLSEQILPIAGQTKEGETQDFRRDEGIRPGGTLEKLGTLPTVFKEDGVVTAGNSSQISDGASALLVMTPERARELGLTPIARVHTAALAATDPVIMLTAPIPATEKALKKSGLSPADIGVFEVNEAFASVPLAWMQEFGVGADRVNPNGGAIAFGHPLGASGARIMTDLIHTMRATGTQYGLQTMCEAGGQANATILELIR
ncbi:thiolase family protein [Brevibacterium jeotgali]|uniref:Acetyl-CoA acyltransferase n=1 Tax=Brevibacterium jeotgali TaxID=1262550 RepID=A0A2H1L5D5_9MICO|nr:thiolase family protein [Brevibacterium jeotgali]TWC01846.1 acetyl-CoA acyltransferase [Brevibacterium jeotgali]SMY11593.1 acetyl-CoA acyltransferase [Brevibacterium jeotgali]